MAPRRLARATLAFALATAGAPASAQAVQWHGHLDLRGVDAPDETAWDEGGLGKARFGAGDDGVVVAAGVLSGTAQLGPEVLASGTLQFVPGQAQPVDVLDAWVRYRPVSTTPWRWSVRAGAFWAPVSVENEGVGWTSLWTLTPSAINSWVGEELRTIGAEASLEHRGASADVEVFAALFGWNDPAGELLAARGWGLGDAYSGLGAVLREPDVYAPRARAPVPMTYRPFREIDGRPGWYAGVTRDVRGVGRGTLVYYDNRAERDSWERYGGHRSFSWHTRFWSGAVQRRIGETVVAFQAMVGSTVFEPQPGVVLDTRFHAGYLLLARETGEWRPAVRVDLFGTGQRGPSRTPLEEHGHAVAVALNWRPRDHVRITGELLRIDSSRAQRRLEGRDSRQVQWLLQVAARWYF
ncbi:MAG TPA: hypothetical protein VFM73_02525 [Xanthomonadaceae bacterium]|nr:hypothetical protein [Xanthomonadaceae bacterium]